MALMVSHIFLLAAGSTPVVGSSNNITFGLCDFGVKDLI